MIDSRDSVPDLRRFRLRATIAVIERELAERHLHREPLRHPVMPRVVHAPEPTLAEQRLDHVPAGERRADQRITLLGRQRREGPFALNRHRYGGPRIRSGCS